LYQLPGKGKRVERVNLTRLGKVVFLFFLIQGKRKEKGGADPLPSASGKKKGGQKDNIALNFIKGRGGKGAREH